MGNLIVVCEILQSGESSEWLGHGAKSWTDTIDCLLSGYLMLAKVGLLSISSPLSTKGQLLLVRTNHLNSTGLGFINVDGNEFPWEVHLWNFKNCSWGVQLVAVLKRSNRMKSVWQILLPVFFPVRFQVTSFPYNSHYIALFVCYLGVVVMSNYW